MTHSYTRLFRKEYWLLILLFFSSISFSWAQFGYTQVASNDCGATTSGASATATSSSSYNWSTGSSDQTVTGLTNGYYTVTLNGTSTVPVIIGVPVAWTDLIKATDATDGKLQATGTHSWGNPGGGQSTARFSAGQEGGFTFLVEDLNTASNFMVGLSTPDNSNYPSYLSIQHSLYIGSDNMLYRYSNAASGVNTGVTVAVNDRITMVRSGNDINYYHNDSLVYTDTNVANAGELVVRMSIIQGTSPKIWTSKCAPSLTSVTYVQNQTDDCNTPASEGSITFTPQDGTEPYTYSGGATTATPTGLANGLLSVTVNDAFSSTTVPVVVGTPVFWTNMQNVSQSQGKLFANNVAANDTNAGAISASALSASTDGGITFINESNIIGFMVGLSESNTDPSWTSLGYSVYLLNNEIYIYESGSFIASYLGLSIGDRISILRQGSSINYYRNNSLLHTTSVNANTQLFADATVWGESPVIYSSFCTGTTANLGLNYTQTVFDDCSTTGTSEGEVTLEGVAGANNTPYTYLWNDASTASTRTNMETGLYTVSVTSGITLSDIPVVLGGLVQWGDLSNASQTGGTLTATSTTNWTTPAGGLSVNRLLPSNDGGISFIVSETNSGNYQVGLSRAAGTNTSWESQEYSVWIGYQNRVVVYESGTLVGRFASVSNGDRISIVRIGNNIRYYINSSLLHTTTVAGLSTQTLFADISVIEGTSPAVSASFCTSLGALAVSYTQTTPDNCATSGTGEGEINVTATGGTGTYTYNWTGSNGATTGNPRTGLSRGLETLIVTSGASSITTPVISGALVNWGNLVSVTQSNGTVTSQSPESGYGATDDGALSTNVLPNGTDGGITYVIPSISDMSNYMIGLSPATSTSAGYASLKYSVFIKNSNTIDIYESGGLSATITGAISVNDRISIIKRGTDIEYYHNNTLIHTTTGVTPEDLYADITIIQGTSPAVYASFCDTGLRVGETTVDEGDKDMRKVVATNEITAKTLFAYPNPSTGKVTVRLSDKAVKGNVAIRVIDVLGRTILTQNAEKQSSTLETSFDLRNQKAGIYFVEITSENQTQRIKIIKE